MAIEQTKGGRWKVDMRNKFGTRIERTFDRWDEAKAFAGGIATAKYYEKTLVKNNLQPKRYSIYAALEEYKLTKINLRPKSVAKYTYNIKLLKESFEAMGINYLDEFTPDHASKLYAELLREKVAEIGPHKGKKFRAKPKTINFFLNTSRSFFQQEVLKGHIDRNPMVHLKNLKVERKRPDFYTREELKSFFAQEMLEVYRNAFIGLLFTATRINELASLTWDDVDFHKRLIYIRPKENFKTKTYNSERAIPMNDVLFELLKKIFQSALSDKYPFCSPTGKKLSDRRMLENCKTVAEKAGIKSRAFLQKFRSTTATMLVENGVSIYSIKEFLGHGSVVQTEVYANHKSDLLHPEVATLNNLLK